ncbi:aspartic proteinase 36-like [Silene latifolia]|uniref:aspartic proteinase 36-like n=1 Tax=Silene latifolia TaxID=37657 RepID=UPI003D76C869
MMDLRQIMVVGLCIILWKISMVYGNAVFKVEHKFKGGRRTIKELRAHDQRRHGRFLATVDLPLGGNGQPSDTGLYFTKVKLGNPPQEYHVQVDTGSDVLWVNCVGCETCPKKSGLGITLNFYNPKSSSTADLINCEQKQCAMIYQGTLNGCEPNMLCQYEVTYGDGSTTSGYFVEDTFHFDQVSGSQQSATGNSSVVFGCGAKQSGQLSSNDEALDGIIGFGQAKSSVLSQLAAAGKVRKSFSHCLDNEYGGGIFAIGQLVEPNLKTIPLIPDQPHYNVVMKSIEVAGDVLQLSTDFFGSDRGAVIDSGTTLAYLPDDIYNMIVDKVLTKRTDLKLHIVEDQFQCFEYSENIDDGFPNIIFSFEDSLNMTIYPHEYFFRLDESEDKWCLGWMNSGIQSRDGKDVTILGDIVLSNKLVYYDLENGTLGWTPYNCSSSIKVKDKDSAAGITVSAHNLSSANALVSSTSLFVVFVLINLLLTISH